VCLELLGTVIVCIVANNEKTPTTEGAEIGGPPEKGRRKESRKLAKKALEVH